MPRNSLRKVSVRPSNSAEKCSEKRMSYPNETINYWIIVEKKEAAHLVESGVD